MLKAGALYFAIVMAFMIAIISASLIMLAAHYRNSYLKEVRYNRLRNNLSSGLIYTLADAEINSSKTIDLFADQTDSLTLTKKQWGIFELATLITFVQRDTLKQAFLIGNETDSTVLYLADEDRPLSASGNTRITGNAALPKSGIKKAYAEGKPYHNKELIYKGVTTFSKRELIRLNPVLLQELIANLSATAKQFPLLKANDLQVSFLDSVQQFKLPKVATLAAIKLKGNIVLFSDSIIHIKANTELDGIQIYAPYIKVDDNFKGNCQLFALDSIIVGNNASFNYPSTLGVIRMPKSGSQPRITLGNQVLFNGIIFGYEELRSPMQTLISLGKTTIVNGEIYTTGLLKLERGIAVNGKVTCNRFIMKTPTTLYENFLIDVNFNRLARSKYYLSSTLFESAKERRVLKWLN